MLSSLHRWLPLILIATAALWLRTTDLARRPMHADEANQAVKFGELLEHGRYTFDPQDHHGPTLYYLALPFAWLRGETTLAEISETTVRLLPAFVGTLAVLLVALLAGPLGRFPAFAAAAFVAVSPPAVYYSRYFIQETLLVTFTLGAFVCAVRWWQTRRLAWVLAVGVSVGLMFATKASAPLFLLAAALALLVFVVPSSGAIPPASSRAPAPPRIRPRFGLHLAAALFSALFVAALFFSSFGRHFAGLRDAIAVYDFSFQRVSTLSGHEKPWSYYLQLLTWQRAGGLVFHQLAFAGLAFVGAIAAFITPRPLLRWAAVYTALVALTLSLTPYKTPWHVVHLVPGLALLAGGALAAIPQWWLTGALAAIAMTFQIRQTQLVAFLRPADSRNPYAYVHSSPDVLKVRALADAALARSDDAIVRVIGAEYWPLPWYLRGLPRVGYWSTPPADCDAALLIVHEAHAELVRARLHGAYRESILGLRPDVLCIVFTQQP